MTANGHARQIVQKLWNYCNVLRDDGLDPDGVWRGRWLQFEQMPAELIPLG